MSNERIPDDKIRELGEYLNGTCAPSGVDEAMRVCGIYPIDEQEQMSVMIRVEQVCEIFCCESCGWWMENDEMADRDGEQTCFQCAESESE